MSCKLRFLGAVVVSSLSPLAAGVLPAVPTIAVTDPLDLTEPPKVVFAPPGATESPASASLIRFNFSTGETQTASPAPEVPLVSPAPSSLVAFPSAPAPAAAALERSTVTQTLEETITSSPAPASATPTVTFATPQYEAPAPAKGPYKAPAHKVAMWVREMLAACLVSEAASQGEFGMRAVMAVIRNRAEGHPRFYARTVLEPKQFSALNRVTEGRETLASFVRRAKRDRVWPTAVAIVEDALDETWHDPTGGATHYTRSAEHTHWTRRLAKTTTIGAHSFYR